MVKFQQEYYHPEDKRILIEVDYRETRSGICEVLTELGADVVTKTLKHGDYIVNGQVMVERKTKGDFVQSVLQQRLFVQCAGFYKTTYQPLLLVEGNPYTSNHSISREAVRGALLAVTVSWQIPVFYTSDVYDSAQTLMLIGQQNLNRLSGYWKGRKKPKVARRQQVYLLQMLPTVGSTIAQRLLEHFGNIENVIVASEEELQLVEGIGKGNAKKIRKLLTRGY